MDDTEKMGMEFLSLLEMLSIILVIVLVVLYCVCCNFSCCVEQKHREGEIITTTQDPEHPYPLQQHQHHAAPLQQQYRDPLHHQEPLPLQQQNHQLLQQLPTAPPRDLLDPPPPYVP